MTALPPAIAEPDVTMAPSHDQALIRGVEELRDHWGPTATRAAMLHVLGEVTEP